MDRYRDEVVDIQTDPGKHRIKVGEEWITARAIVICTGARWRKLGIEGEERFAGKGVSYCALCDGNFSVARMSHALAVGTLLLRNRCIWPKW